MASILAVDGNKNVRLLLEQELTDEGHSVALACNGADTLAYLSQHCPDLVILDVALPDIDGSELLQHLLCRDCTMPVVLYSACFGIQERLDQLPADAHLLKSGDLTELKVAVNRLLESRSNLRSA